MILLIIGLIILACAICLCGYILGVSMGYNRGFEDAYKLGILKGRAEEFHEFEKTVTMDASNINN